MCLFYYKKFYKKFYFLECRFLIKIYQKSFKSFQHFFHKSPFLISKFTWDLCKKNRKKVKKSLAIRFCLVISLFTTSFWDVFWNKKNFTKSSQRYLTQQYNILRLFELRNNSLFQKLQQIFLRAKNGCLG